MKDRVCQVVLDRPGLKSREIAQHLGIDRRDLNRFLWGEGLQNRSLIARNWRWYPSDYIQPPLVSQPRLRIDAVRAIARPVTDDIKAIEAPPRTLCGVLKSMDELGAIREIRRLDLLSIEKAFSEVEYADLSEALQIELVRCLEEIKQLEAGRKAPRSTGNLLLRWMVIGVALYGGIILVSKILHVLSK
jgi:hypothetical protein